MTPEKQTNIEAIRNRLLVGTLVCAVLLIVGYFVLVATPWGHQFDDQAFFGREALSRKVIDWDYHLLAHVSKKALLCAAILLIVIGVAAPLYPCWCHRSGGIRKCGLRR